ncbi:MAG: 4-hydroxy-tetrahydrodipicolinate synthase [Deltaproteobacteria bacterium HGW-Deltaproteobacteria-14]|jgi:4-hydroxy-tetrahydrodipicolinate synthase|nr:MAG: 4-hydroxy-tetrahydrodipicolinate synthase [Deltaproteobacteria bacterium HGW-Deltaproteobacteria-14]
MTLPRPLTGTLTALYTPFLADGTLDLDAWRALCERLASAGSGLVPCGTTGETPALTDGEYQTLVRVAVEVAAGRVPVIAGTGSSSTERTIATTRAAAEVGADAALVVTPPYNKPPQRSLLAHFRAVADQGGLPIVLYNVPSRTGCNMLPETTLELARDPRFVAVKEAAGSVAQIEQLIYGAPDGFTVLSGDDALTFPLVALGGHGVISVAANVAPEPMVALVAALLAGDLGRARTLQRALTPLFGALFATTNPIPLKHAAALLGHARATMRLPLTADAVDDALSKRIAAALAHAREASAA